MNIAVGSISSLADSVIPNMLTAVSSTSPASATEQQMVGEGGEDAAEARRAGGEAHRDREHVVDDQRRGRQQRRDAPQVELRDGIRAAALGVGGDHLRVGHDEQDEHRR